MMTSGGYSKAEAWNLQLQARVKEADTQLRAAERLLGRMSRFYMDNKRWSRACAEARTFLRTRAEERRVQKEQIADFKKLLKARGVK